MDLVGLLLIAKNEAHVIGRALDSGREVGVDSMTVVVDASTTDDTCKVARAHGADVIVRPYPGTIAAARNEAIGLVRGKSHYTLMLDPDDAYEGQLPSQLGADVYDVWIHEEGSRMPRVQLFRSDAPVKYEGIRHELLMVPEGLTYSVAPNLVYRRIGGGWQDSLGKHFKFMAHARDLQAWLGEHPQDGRAMYLLAQSYRDASEFESARRCYEDRIAFEGGDPQERYLSALEVAFLVEHHGRGDLVEVTAAYLRAHELAPMHAEPLFHLASYLREHGSPSVAWNFARRAVELPRPRGRVIIHDVEVYEWKALAELALSSWMLGDRGTATRALKKIIDTQPDYQEWAEQQLAVVVNEEPPARKVVWPASRLLKE